MHVEGVTKMVTTGGGLADFVGAAWLLVKFDDIDVLNVLVPVDAGGGNSVETLIYVEAPAEDAPVLVDACAGGTVETTSPVEALIEDTSV